MKMTALATLALAAAFTACAAPSDPGMSALEPNAYGTWNANDDDCLDMTEFGDNWENEFGVWDADDTGFIEDAEWQAEVGVDEGQEFGVFGDWDMDDDDRISDDEFATGSFGVFDEDDDDCIAETEFSAGIDMF